MLIPTMILHPALKLFSGWMNWTLRGSGIWVTLDEKGLIYSVISTFLSLRLWSCYSIRQHQDNQKKIFSFNVGKHCCWEAEMARHVIIYQPTGWNQWFGWMVKDLEGT